MADRDHLLRLADLLASHGGVSTFAISARALGKGDFFKRLADGRDCRTRTAQRLLKWFSENWPADLPWPEGVPRPQVEREEAA